MTIHVEGILIPEEPLDESYPPDADDWIRFCYTLLVVHKRVSDDGLSHTRFAARYDYGDDQYEVGYVSGKPLLRQWKKDKMRTLSWISIYVDDVGRQVARDCDLEP